LKKIKPRTSLLKSRKKGIKTIKSIQVPGIVFKKNNVAIKSHGSRKMDKKIFGENF
jgi:hypothetical protein